MQFSEILKEIMEERGWSAYRLAKLMDISQSTVSHWLAGDTKPQKNTMRRLEEVFAVKRGYFETEQKEKPAAPKSDGLYGLSETERALIELYRSDETAKERFDFELEMGRKRKAAQKDS